MVAALSNLAHFRLPAEHQSHSATLTPTDLIGRLVEVTGQGASARTTWVSSLVAEAQRAGETVAWIQRVGGMLYPPDLAAAGVDVAALAVVLMPDGPALLRAADVLLRSGGFGLCVVDLERPPEGQGAALHPSDAQLGRLLGLCQKHGAAVLFLTRPQDAPTLGSLVSLRLEVRREAREAGRFAVRVEVAKDKRRGPGRVQEAMCHGPEGL